MTPGKINEWMALLTCLVSVGDFQRSLASLCSIHSKGGGSASGDALGIQAWPKALDLGSIHRVVDSDPEWGVCTRSRNSHHSRGHQRKNALLKNQQNSSPKSTGEAQKNLKPEIKTGVVYDNTCASKMISYILTEIFTQVKNTGSLRRMDH